jgi:hypothetical protein
MAGDNAFQAGFGMESSRKQKQTDDDPDKQPERKKGRGKGGSGSGGGMSWSILPVIGKALGFGGSRKKGGPIKKTGVYLIHKNEYVVPAKRSKGKTTRKRAVIKF